MTLSLFMGAGCSADAGAGSPSGMGAATGSGAGPSGGAAGSAGSPDNTGAGAAASAGGMDGAGGAPFVGAGGAPFVGAGGAPFVGAGGAPFVGAGGAPFVGAGGAAPVGTGGSGGTDPVTVGVCNPIVAGQSTVMVNGVARTFSVQMPADTSHMALLFLWHGWNQNPTDFANKIVYDTRAGTWVPFDPNAFPMPLMIVTPLDTKLLPPAGLDWDIASGAKDIPFFDTMLGCIQQQFNIDKSRMYSFGFSAGAVFSNLLTAKHPHLFAATISESGTWFSDQAEWSDVSVPIMTWTWPALDPADQGNVLLSHGGSSDFATVISLESANQKAMPYLHNNGRTVTECAHTFGHTLVPDLTQSMYYQYLWAHQLGGPPITGLPPSFPTPARPVGKTACTFHP
jgi:predicted esterase